MDLLKLTEGKLNSLKMLAMEGADNAAFALSKWLGEKMRLKIFDVCVRPIKDTAKIFGESDQCIVAILARLDGGINGYLLLAFSQESAFTLMNKVLKYNKLGHREEWDELAISVMEETANIVGSAFVNELAETLDVSITYNSPKLTIDYANSILEFILIEDAMVGDYAMFFETEFYSAHAKIDGHLLLLPTPDSISVLIKEIE